jgi:two-component system LytT family response regulator
MRKIRVLTVDDESLALRRLQLLLRTIIGVEHVGEASSCEEALTRTAALAPEVILLDIKMRDGDGFEVAERLAQRPGLPVIIFVTAFDRFAIRAFESEAADYLLKPVERDRLELALRRARRRLEISDAELRVSELQATVRNLRAATAGKNGVEFETEFWLRASKGVVQVPIDAIDCISSEDDYIAVHTPNGSHLMRGSIRQFERRVEPGHFVRVHRRWLVRKSGIVEIRVPKLGSAQVLLRSGKCVPAGRVYLKALRRLMRNDRGAM